MLYFRKLNINDKEQVLAICEDIWEGDDYIPYVFDEWLTASGDYFVGYFDDDTLVAFGKLTQFSKGEFWLEGLRKNHKLKVKGVGKKLTQHLLEYMNSIEYSSLRFATYFDNVQSIALSESVGFKKIKTWSYLGEDVNELKFNESNIILDSASLEEIHSFIINSQFLKSMDKLFNWNWKVYDYSLDFLKSKTKDLKWLVIKSNGDISSLLIYFFGRDKSLNVPFYEFSNENDESNLINKVKQIALESNCESFESIAPTMKHVELMKKYDITSWEQINDFFVYQYFRGQ